MDAGFLSLVEIGQYFMTEDNGESQFEMQWIHFVPTVNTLFQEHDGSSQPKGWTINCLRETQKIGPVLEVTTTILLPVWWTTWSQWRLEFGLLSGSSQPKDNTHSWVRISHGSNKFVMKIRTTTTQKFLKISLMNKRYNWM